MAREPNEERTGKRVLRLLLKITAVLLASVLVLLTVALLILQTGWGREKVRRLVESKLDEAITGRVTIAAVDGFLPFRPVLRDVAIHENTGDAALRIASMRIEYSLFALLGNEFSSKEIKLDGVRAHLRQQADGRLNLQALLASAVQDVGPPSKPWTVEIDRLLVADSEVVYESANPDSKGSAMSATALRGEARVVWDGRAATITLRQLATHLQEPDLDLSLVGEGRVAEASWRLDRVKAQAGESRLGIDRVIAVGNVIHGDFSVALARQDAARLALLPEWTAAIDLQGSFSRAELSDAFDVVFAGSVATARVRFAGSLSPSRMALAGKLEFTDLNPGAVLATAPGARLAGAMTLSVEAKTPSLDAIAAAVKGTATGTFEQVTLDELVVDAKLEAGVLSGQAKLRVPGTSATVVGALHVAKNPMFVETARIRGHTRRLSALIVGQPVAGELEIDAQASGPLDNLVAQGTGDLRGFRYDKTTAESAKLRFRFAGLPKNFRGRVDATVKQVRSADVALGDMRATVHGDASSNSVQVALHTGDPSTPYQLDGELRVERRGHKYHAKINELNIRTRTTRWLASHGEVTLHSGKDVSFDNISFSSNAGELGLDGRLFAPWSKPTGRIKATVARLRLPALRSVLQLDVPVLLGAVRRAQVDVALGPHSLTGSASLVADEVAWRDDMPHVSVDLDAELRGQELTVAGAARLEGSGRAKIVLRSAVPAEPLRPSAWTRLQPGSLRSGHITLTHLDLSGVAMVAGLSAADLQGFVTGAATVRDRGLDLDVRLRRVEARDWPEPVSGHVIARLEKQTVSLSADLATATYGVAKLELAATPPVRPFDADQWRVAGRRTLRSASLRVSDVPLSSIAKQLARLGHELPVSSGTCTAALTLQPDASAVALDMDLKDAEFAWASGRKIPPVSARVHVALSDAKTVATVRAVANGKTIASAKLNVDAGLLQLWRRDNNAFLQARASGSAGLTDLPVPVLAGALDLSEDLRGSVYGNATLAGTLARPSVRGQVAATRARFESVSFDSFVVKGHVNATDAALEVNASQHRGGAIALHAKIRRDTQQVSASLKANKFDLRFLSGLARGKRGLLLQADGLLDANVGMQEIGDRRTASGWVHVTQGRLALRQGLQPLREIDANLRFAKDRMTLVASASSGAGRIRAQATAGIRNLLPQDVRGTVVMERFPVASGATVVAVDMKTELSGRRQRALWKIDAHVTKGTVHLPKETGRELQDLAPFEDVVFVDDVDASKAAGSSASQLLNLRLAVRAPHTLRVRGNDVDVTLDVDLTATYLGGQTGLAGTVDVVRGYAKIQGQRFEVVSAHAAYDGTMPPNPRIDVRLARNYGNLTVFVVVKGQMDDPQLTFESDPPGRDKADLIAIVAGRDPGDQRKSTKTLEDRATAVASSFLLKRVQGVVKDVLPIDVLQVEPSKAEEQGGTQITVGKWITDDLYVVGRRRAGASASENEFEVEARYALDILGKPLVEAVYGDKKQGVDLLWVFQF